ncbi:hypothetical protein EAF04_004375 [Stromatinia cepivora]|nr:hypothetical protein EAF04_004375 [Stromatinia cepivora]
MTRRYPVDLGWAVNLTGSPLNASAVCCPSSYFPETCFVYSRLWFDELFPTGWHKEAALSGPKPPKGAKVVELIILKMDAMLINITTLFLLFLVGGERFLWYVLFHGTTLTNDRLFCIMSPVIFALTIDSTIAGWRKPVTNIPFMGAGR